MFPRRSLPPAAAPIGSAGISSGIRGMFRGRKEIERFRSELKEYFGVRHCFLVSSGKAALALILMALKELSPARDGVLIPAFTCYSVPSSVIRAGLRIRLCDLQSNGFDFDFAQVSTLLSGTARPRGADRADPGRALLAVVPTHLFGYPADVQRLRNLIQDRGITIVEDAAQAMGESREGRKLGTLGDVGFFSLGRGKAFSTVEGGVIVTDQDDIARVLKRRVDSLPGYGFWGSLKLVCKAAGLALLIHPMLFWIPRSLRFLRLGETLFERDFPILRMSSFQAGLAANWVERLRNLRDARMANVKRWLAILEEIGNCGPWLEHSRTLGLVRYPIRVRDPDRRSSLLQESAERGAGVAPVYPDSINRLPELRAEIPAQACPIAESCASELVTLPTHAYLTPDDMAMLRRLLSRAVAAGGD